MTDAEIIEAVAVKVMLWERKDPVFLIGRGLAPNSAWFSRSPDGKYEFGASIIWNPLTNPADREMVEDRLAELFEFMSMEYSEGAPRFIFHISRELPFVTFEAQADTRGMAVCLCALKSVGVEV